MWWSFELWHLFNLPCPIFFFEYIQGGNSLFCISQFLSYICVKSKQNWNSYKIKILTSKSSFLLNLHFLSFLFPEEQFSFVLTFFNCSISIRARLRLFSLESSRAFMWEHSIFNVSSLLWISYKLSVCASRLYVSWNQEKNLLRPLNMSNTCES